MIESKDAVILTTEEIRKILKVAQYEPGTYSQNKLIKKYEAELLFSQLRDIIRELDRIE